MKVLDSYSLQPRRGVTSLGDLYWQDWIGDVLDTQSYNGVALLPLLKPQISSSPSAASIESLSAVDDIPNYIDSS